MEFVFQPAQKTIFFFSIIATLQIVLLCVAIENGLLSHVRRIVSLIGCAERQRLCGGVRVCMGGFVVCVCLVIVRLHYHNLCFPPDEESVAPGK